MILDSYMEWAFVVFVSASAFRPVRSTQIGERNMSDSHLKDGLRLSARCWHRIQTLLCSLAFLSHHMANLRSYCALCFCSIPPADRKLVFLSAPRSWRRASIISAPHLIYKLNFQPLFSLLVQILRLAVISFYLFFYIHTGNFCLLI